MAYVSLSKMPSHAREYVVDFQQLNGGLNLQELDYRIKNDESPEMKNLWWKDGILCSRDGQSWVNDEGLGEYHASYDSIWNGKMFVHAGNKIYVVNPLSGEGESVYTGGSDMDVGGTFFPYNERMYYKTKGYYAVIDYDGSEFTGGDVEGYTPITYINCSPDNGSGVVYQPENRISAKKELWYNSGYTLTNTVTGNISVSIEDAYFRMWINVPGSYTFTYDGSVWKLNGTAVDPLDYGIRIGGTPVSGNKIVVTLAFKNVYYLPVKGTGLSVTKVVVDGAEKTVVTDYTVDTTNGTVTFTTAPTCYFPEINNTVQITYSLENSVAEANIMDCTQVAVYGGTGALCIVMAGSTTQPNAYFWNGQNSVAMDPSYFPMTQYQLASDMVDPITGFGKQQGYLIIFKKGSVGRTSLSTEEVNGRLTIDLPYVPINAKIGCDLPSTIQLIENNLTWCNTQRGVHFLANTSSAYENNVICISDKIEASNDNWSQGMLYDVRNAANATSHDDGNRYWLIVDEHVWLWDYYISNYKDPAWFYFDNIKARGMIQDHAEIWHFDSNCRLTKFNDTFSDYGEGIDKVYRFATQYFGTYDNHKNVNSVIINTRPLTNSIVDVVYITDYEERADLTPLDARSWSLVPRDLTMRNLSGAGFAKIFRRKPHCRRVQYFTMRLKNSLPNNDMAIVSAQIYYIFQGRYR